MADEHGQGTGSARLGIRQGFDQEAGTIVDSSIQAWQTCIDKCNECMQACEECFTSCLEEADVKARTHCIQLLRDCADICALASQFMSRGSSLAAHLCKVCADVCDACAAECANFKDTHCQECARICSECAEECRMMAR